MITTDKASEIYELIDNLVSFKVVKTVELIKKGQYIPDQKQFISIAEQVPQCERLSEPRKTMIDVYFSLNKDFIFMLTGIIPLK